MKIKISRKVVKGMQAAKCKHVHAALYYATMLTDISTVNTKKIIYKCKILLTLYCMTKQTLRSITITLLHIYNAQTSLTSKPLYHKNVVVSGEC